MAKRGQTPTFDELFGIDPERAAMNAQMNSLLGSFQARRRYNVSANTPSAAINSIIRHEAGRGTELLHGDAEPSRDRLNAAMGQHAAAVASGDETEIAAAEANLDTVVADARASAGRPRNEDGTFMSEEEAAAAIDFGGGHRRNPLAPPRSHGMGQPPSANDLLRQAVAASREQAAQARRDPGSTFTIQGT